MPTTISYYPARYLACYSFQTTGFIVATNSSLVQHIGLRNYLGVLGRKLIPKTNSTPNMDCRPREILQPMSNSTQPRFTIKPTKRPPANIGPMIDDNFPLDLSGDISAIYTGITMYRSLYDNIVHL